MGFSITDRVGIAISLSISVASLCLAVYTFREVNRRGRLCFPRSILLIRHGESEGNAKEDTYGNTPDPLVSLTDLGRKQSEELGKKLREKVGESPVWVYVSLLYMML